MRQPSSWRLLFLLCVVSSLAQADTTLVNYNFDYDVLESGPDTYQIFEHKNAKAEISNKYAAGGYASAHLTDQAGDKDFVELQGYFPEQQSGQVRFRFKLLIAGETDLFTRQMHKFLASNASKPTNIVV